MGLNDARDMLEACKAQSVRDEAELARLRRLLEQRDREIADLRIVLRKQDEERAAAIAQIDGQAHALRLMLVDEPCDECDRPAEAWFVSDDEIFPLCLEHVESARKRMTP